VIGIAILGAMTAAACPAADAGLDRPVTATWNGIGLREWASRVSEIAGLPVLVDRRLDPDTAIRLDCRDEPLRDVLDRGAAIVGGEVAILRASVRIVRPGMAVVVRRAEKARELRVASLPAAQRAVLDRTMPWHSPAGARPRDLVADTIGKAGIAVEGLDMVPHDHLPATSLSEIGLAEALDMLLAAFDLRVDWQAGRAAAGNAAARLPTGRIVPIDAGLPPAAGTTAAAMPREGKPPRRPLPIRPQPATERQTFSLQVAAPLEELLTVIATRLDLVLDLDRESLTRGGIAPGEIVRATVKDASRDELLHAILDPLALDWKIDGKTLQVFAR
jgi:hypothetical protein